MRVATSHELLGLFISNALRQALGAALFFVTTLLLSRSMGDTAYARYFVGWNLAQILVGFVSFGLYNDTIRRLSLGAPPRRVLVGLLRPCAVQIGVLAGVAVFLWRFSDYEVTSVLLIAAATTLGTLLTAIALGLGAFRVFGLGELLHNVVLLLAVAVVKPDSPGQIGWLFILAMLAKGFLYWLMLQHHWKAPAADAASRQSLPQTGTHSYALLSYGHSLLQITAFRGFVLASGYLLSPSGMAQLAVVWALCDRALLLVQGINQVLYPKLLRSSVSAAFRLWTNIGTSVAYVLTSVMLILAWMLLGHFGWTTPLAIEYPALILCVAFVPHVVRLLLMTEALAESRFKPLFASHAVTIGTFVVIFLLCMQLNAARLWMPAALVFITSSMGVVVLLVGVSNARQTAK